MTENGGLADSPTQEPSTSGGDGVAVHRRTSPTSGSLQRTGTGRDPTVTDSAGPLDAAALQERIGELELRLREWVEENHILSEEVRCLLAERAVRDEYIASIEHATVQLSAMNEQIHELDRQLDAYRNRLVCVAADRVAETARQFPAATRVARYLRRTLIHRPRH